MSLPNGHAHEPGGTASVTPAAALVAPAVPQFSPETVKGLVAALEVPFEAWQIEWRVMNTTKNGQPVRGQVVPYADQRAYTDRLNTLFTPAGWTRRYTIHTSANFERSKDEKIVAKVLVTCELTIFGLGSHSATGEEWADNDNAGTAAEAQAYKRTCSCFGLGRYLYYFEGVWVDLDERKRPRSVPELPKWATPEGWAQGFRPKIASKSNGASNAAKIQQCGPEAAALTKQIEGMAELLGRGLYRGLLRDLARVWNPREIQDASLLQKVLEHMRSAERGLRRVEAALDKTGPEALAPILKAIRLSSLERVDNLETLKRIVLELEGAAENKF
ncbi:MAG TPA: Rad52/Rad22 family DNA repair protein [Terriglobales bacterium]